MLGMHLIPLNLVVCELHNPSMSFKMTEARTNNKSSYGNKIPFDNIFINNYKNNFLIPLIQLKNANVSIYL